MAIIAPRTEQKAESDVKKADVSEEKKAISNPLKGIADFLEQIDPILSFAEKAEKSYIGKILIKNYLGGNPFGQQTEKKMKVERFVNAVKDLIIPVVLIYFMMWLLTVFVLVRYGVAV